MSEKRQIKQIDLNTLETADRKISVARAKKALMALSLLLVLSGGGYAAYRVVAGDVVGSRFMVEKMSCPACAVTVKEVTTEIPGVVGTRVSLAAKDVTVEFCEKQTSPDRIKNAIEGAGYPARLDGLFRKNGAGIGEVVAATVNSRPLFEKELEFQFDPSGQRAKTRDHAAAFFTAVGKEILLQAADKETVVVQPCEIEQEIEETAQSRGMTKEDFLARIKTEYGSTEKYNQIVGQCLGIKRFLDDYALNGITDPRERDRKTMELVGKLFSDADVQIVDPKLKEKLFSAVGKEDWKTFWPRMIGTQTALRALLTQRPQSDGSQ
jgi:copper chaperone CopZ